MKRAAAILLGVLTYAGLITLIGWMLASYPIEH